MTRPAIVAGSFTLAATAIVFAAAAPRPQQSTLDPFPANLLRIDALVEGQSQDFVTGLTKDDFQISTDGRPVAVEWFSAAPSPLSLEVLVDITASQSPGDRVRQGTWGASSLVAGSLNNGRSTVSMPQRPIPQFNLYGIQGWDRVRPGAIAGQLYLASQFADASGDLRRDWSLVFDQAPARWFGNSAIWDAIYDAAGTFGGASERPAIVLVTDGEASGNVHSSHEAIEAATLAGIPVFVVAEEAVLGFGPAGRAKYGAPGIDLVSRGIDPTAKLKMLADATGGTYALDYADRNFNLTPRNPTRWVSRAIDGLHHAYTLGIAPIADGAVHTLAVSVKRPGAVVHARTMYRESPPAPVASSSPAAASASGAAAVKSRGGGSAPAPLLPAGTMDLTRVHAWIAAVATHQPGVADAAAVQIAQWPPDVLIDTAEDVGALARALAFRHARDRQCRRDNLTNKSMDPPPSCEPFDLLYRGNKLPTMLALDELFGLTDAEAKTGVANRVLERGALLHTDIAVLAATDPLLVNHTLGSAHSASAARISDGEVLAIEDTSQHWTAARCLLDSVESNPDRLIGADWTAEVEGDPAGDEVVRAWYRLASAYHMSRLQWPYATPILVRGLEIFPADPVLLFYRGMMHEIFAMPLLQGAAQSLIRVGVSERVQAPAQELQQAEHYLRLAVAADPSQVEAKIRLGRVLGLLGRHDEALTQLRQAIDGLTDPRLSYLAALFLGREFEQQADDASARAAFARAAVLYPAAQAPLIAESALLRRAGDPATAQPPLEQLLARPSLRPADDPWWTYGLPPVGVTQAIIARLRYAFTHRGGQ